MPLGILLLLRLLMAFAFISQSLSGLSQMPCLLCAPPFASRVAMAPLPQFFSPGTRSHYARRPQQSDGDWRFSVSVLAAFTGAGRTSDVLEETKGPSPAAKAHISNKSGERFNIL